MSDHSETIQIDFDPGQITYDELLDAFWDSHDATQRSYSRQYASVIFFHDSAQEEAALASKAREEARRGRAVVTEIVPAGDFHLAEDYHQKYYLRGDGMLMNEFAALYPDPAAFVDSTSAARVNGYLGGNGTLSQLESEIDRLGLSVSANERLKSAVSR